MYSVDIAAVLRTVVRSRVPSKDEKAAMVSEANKRVNKVTRSDFVILVVLCDFVRIKGTSSALSAESIATHIESGD